VQALGDMTIIGLFEATPHILMLRSVSIGALLQIAYVLRAPLSELIPGTRAMETAWATPTTSVLPPAVQEITRTLVEYPDRIA
jgi:hypothetical protein